MTPSQKLRSIADSTGLDGIADAIREIANEIEHNNAPAVPIQVNDAMAIAFHNALSDGPIDLDEMDDIKTGLNAALANVQAPAPTVPRGEAWGYVDHRGCAIKFKNARHRSELANAIECGGLEYLYTSPAEKLSNDIQSALESLVERCNHDAGMSNEDAVIHAEAVLEHVYNSRSTTPAPAPAQEVDEAQIQKHTTGPRRQTPGPWLSKEIAWQYDGSHALVWCDKSKGGEHWRRLDEQCNGRFSAPDAQLLAAAPELLEALQHYLSQDEIAEGYGGGVGGSARDQASAAIAKATGATHE